MKRVAMDESVASVPPQIVARHGAALRKLARVLVGERGDADDVVQETWLRFLQARPQSGALGGWLATVLRRLASNQRRDRARRSEREAFAAGSGTVDGSEMFEREESLRAVVDAVLSLEEPYKTVVWLRWFEGLAPREIASRTGVEASVVHTRLARAHGKLREKLARELGPERSLALLGLLAGGRARDLALPTLASIGGWLMGAKWMLGAVVAVALVGVVWWWSSAAPREATTAVERLAMAAEPLSIDAERARTDVPPTMRTEPERERIAVVDAERLRPNWPAPTFEYEVEFIAFGEFDLPVEDREVAAAPAGTTPNVLGKTDRDGRMTARWRGFEPTMEIDVVLAGNTSMARRRVFAGRQTIALRDCRTQPSLNSAIQLSALLETRAQADGSALHIVSWLPVRGFNAPSFAHALKNEDGTIAFVSSTPDGETGIDRLEESLVVGEVLMSRAVLVNALAAAESDESSPPGLFSVSGRVLDEHDEPLVACAVIARRADDGSLVSASTDEAGTFLLEELACGEWTLSAANSVMRPLQTRVSGAHGDKLRWDVSFQCGRELRGRVLGRNGMPLVGWTVFAEREDGGFEPFVDSSRTDTEGRFRMCGVAAGGLRVLLAPPGHDRAPMVLSESVFASADELLFELDLGTDAPHGSMVFSTTDADGQPAPILAARAWRLDSERSSDGVVTVASNSVDDGTGASAEQLSDVRVQFEGLLPGWYRIEIKSAGRPLHVIDAVHVQVGEELDLGSVKLGPVASVTFNGSGKTKFVRRSASAELYLGELEVVGARALALEPGLYAVRCGDKTATFELELGSSLDVDLVDASKP